MMEHSLSVTVHRLDVVTVHIFLLRSSLFAREDGLRWMLGFGGMIPLSRCY